MGGFVTRFAPSPTGPLHLGHAASALTGFHAARAAGGRFLLRIEDIDRTRSRPEHEAALLADLAWLGLSWETPVRRQSEHLADYDAALRRLADDGLVYRCFQTRKDLEVAAAPHGRSRPHTGRPLPPAEEAALIAAGRPYALRLSLAAARTRLGDRAPLTFEEVGAGPKGESGLQAVNLDLAGDIVLARKDAPVAYHLAVVVDDALQGVSQVVRGEDLFEATHIQRVLQTLLGLPVPTYRHHALVRDPSGRRLAKRDGDAGLSSLRAAGADPAAVRRSLGFD